jgi:hypothetical protein
LITTKTALSVIITGMEARAVTDKRRVTVVQHILPELIWSQASAGLPARMADALRRWVTLGAFCGDDEGRLSRYSGGRG